MVLAFITYMKNRRIGSTYPSIDSKPDSKFKKAFKKVQQSFVRKCANFMNSMPFVRPKPCSELINAIQLQGMTFF